MSGKDRSPGKARYLPGGYGCAGLHAVAPFRPARTPAPDNAVPQTNVRPGGYYRTDSHGPADKGTIAAAAPMRAGRVLVAPGTRAPVTGSRLPALVLPRTAP